MTPRTRNLLLVAVAVAALTAALVPVARSVALRREVASVVSRYALALAESTEVLDVAPLAEVAAPRAQARVANYIMLLQGTDTRLESDLLSQDVLSVSSEDETVTATVQEEWRFIERRISSGEQSSPERVIDRTVEYTLGRNPQGKLVVEIALFSDEQGLGQ